MKLRSVYELPPDKQRALRRARRIAWWSLFWQGSVAGLMFAVAGSSQTMKIAWIEDTLSMVPALVFLITEGFRGRQPNRRFPYGYNRVPGMAFLAASVALVLFGLFLAIDSLATLSSHEHPSIKPMSVLGISVWSGWIMIAALVYSIFPPVILGYKKLHLAKELHDKTLYVDAEINRANWMTALAGIAGIVGIRLGYWWADAVAALLISIDILRDGFFRSFAATADLVDQAPTHLQKAFKMHEVVARVREAVCALPWVADADLRMHSEGRLFAGEAFIVAADPDEAVNWTDRFSEVRRVAGEVDWRVADIVPTLVDRLEK